MDYSEVIEQVHQVGYTIISQAYSKKEVEQIKQQIQHYIAQPHPGIVTEADGKTIRGVHGPHLYDEFFMDMCKDPRLLMPARGILAESCYVHQFKINFKKKKVGQAWPWHQDYIYWKNEDNLRAPRLMNVAVLLNDVEMSQGPLCFIPKSHVHGDLTNVVKEKTGWEQDVSNDLTYQIDQTLVNEMIEKNGTEYITGKAGDILIFDPLLIHSSSTNVSPQDRELLIITYNVASNTPVIKENMRPEFLCATDTTPLA